MSHRLRQAVFLVAGYLCVLVGVIGALVPIMPTTPFLLAAIWCFFRGSPRISHWLTTNRWFGTLILNYRARAKMKSVAVIGVSYHTASLELRERVAWQTEAISDALRRFADNFPGGECVLLSTCNRTEAYLVGLDKRAQRRFKNLFFADARSSLYRKPGAWAVAHLFAVAAGLDSMVVGETEILGQVKRAFALAEERGTVGRTFQPLFQGAFKTAKRVHTETSLGRGRISISSLAVQFAETLFSDLASRTVLVIGAGDTAELALKSLVDRGVRNVCVVNRTAERLQTLTERFGARSITLDAIAEQLRDTDIVISSTSAPHIMLSAQTVQRAMAARSGRPLLLIDLAVPRDIEREAGDINDVHLYDLDDLKQLADANLASRRHALAEAWKVVREETAQALDPINLAK